MRQKAFTFILALMFGFQLSAQTTTVEKPYHPDADAKKELAAAVAKAAQEKKHVFVMIGGNWCKWCLAFNSMVNNTPDVKKMLTDNYEVVHLNYSKENKNMDILAQLQHPERFGFPVFVILDGKGNLLHTQNSAYLEAKDSSVGHDPQVVKKFLEGWTYKALDPATY